MSQTKVNNEELLIQAAQQILGYCELVGRSKSPVAKRVFMREARKWGKKWQQLNEQTS